MTDKLEISLEEYPEKDTAWSQEQWKSLVDFLVGSELVTWHQICALVLGHLNPSQVGTSIASKKSFQKHFPYRKTWQAVRRWHFDQPGLCSDCGTRLELQADHVIAKQIVKLVGEEMVDTEDKDPAALLDAIKKRINEELKKNPNNDVASDELKQVISEALRNAILDQENDRTTFAEVADRLENMVLRCRRCNVVRRPSHRRGGKTYLTAEAALMWILFVKRPHTYQDFQALCRSYGLTMANIRFEEAWAMAVWLTRDEAYLIDSSSKYV